MTTADHCGYPASCCVTIPCGNVTMVQEALSRELKSSRTILYFLQEKEYII